MPRKKTSSPSPPDETMFAKDALTEIVEAGAREMGVTPSVLWRTFVDEHARLTRLAALVTGTTLKTDLAERARRAAIQLLRDAEQLETLEDAGAISPDVVRRVLASERVIAADRVHDDVNGRIERLLDTLGQGAHLYRQSRALREAAANNDTVRELAEGIDALARRHVLEKITDPDGPIRRATHDVEIAIDKALQMMAHRASGGSGQSWTKPFKVIWLYAFNIPLHVSDESLRNRAREHRGRLVSANKCGKP